MLLRSKLIALSARLVLAAFSACCTLHEYRRSYEKNESRAHLSEQVTYQRNRLEIDQHVTPIILCRDADECECYLNNIAGFERPWIARGVSATENVNSCTMLYSNGPSYL